MADKVQTIKVKSGRKDDKVALWEVHPDHPNGEVYVAGQDGKPVEVAETPKVLNALKNGQLLKVSGAAAVKATGDK